MDRTRIIRDRDSLVERYGAWTMHSIHLGDGVYTTAWVPRVDRRLRRCLQVAADMIFEPPLDKVRVLDLACLEGQFGIEFALHGSDVVAIEGREVHVAKAQFAKEVLSLDNFEVVREDVRLLSRERFGSYDVILALGILYHLNAPDVMEFAEKLYESCNRITIIDTHFSLEPNDSYTWKGNVYCGTYCEEHRPDSTEQEQLDAIWNSMDNLRSFWLTRASLCNLLRHVGFTSVYECLNPYECYDTDDRHVIFKDRAVFVAVKGKKQHVISSPNTHTSPEIDRPERPEYGEAVRLADGTFGWSR